MDFLLNKIENIGIGVDIEDVNRFTKLGGNKAFLKKVFTQNELDYCFSKKVAAPHLAVRYAGKEAVVKALYNMGGHIASVKLEYKPAIEVTRPRSFMKNL